MIAYEEIMRWAVRSSLQGRVFCDVPHTSSQKTVVNSLRPIVKELYLPIPSVLWKLCTSVHAPSLAHFYIFNDKNDPECNPFAKPKGAVISDINTGRCYLRTYDQLVKNPEDMLRPCI